VHTYPTSNPTSLKSVAISKTWHVHLTLPSQAHGAAKVLVPIPLTFISSSPISKIGKAVALVRKKGEWNPNKWGVIFDEECLDNPEMRALPIPPWPEGEGGWKRKKKKGVSCVVM
jgi:hypothetical protein